MKHKHTKIIKFLSLCLCFLLLFEQTGLAQVIPSQIGAPLASAPLLRYLSVNPANPFNYFNFLLDKGLSPQGTLPDLTKEAKKLIHYFFLGITLPDEAFWVNLRPDEPGRITSEELSQTDLGKTLLEQDLRLKKDVSKLLHPHNPKGKEFWTRLYETIGKNKAKKAQITTSNRVWIVPDKAVVLETEDGALVVEAKLKVLLENEYFSNKKGLSPSELNQSNPKGTVPKSQEQNIQLLSENLMKEIVLPALTQDINTSSTYAPLRQIYHSLILAEWFKRKHPVRTNEDLRSPTSNGTSPVSPYVLAIDKGYIKGLESELPWSKDSFYQQYLNSYQEGEYKLEANLFGLRRMYWSGGIIFFGGEGSSPITIIQKAANDLNKIPQLPEFTITREKEGNLALVLYENNSAATKGGEFAGTTTVVEKEATSPKKKEPASNEQAQASRRASSPAKKNIREVIFGKPLDENEKAMIQKAKEVLDNEFGIWTDELAKRKTEQIIIDLRKMLKKICGKISGEKDIDSLADDFLYSDKMFQGFKTALAKIKLNPKQTHITVTPILDKDLGLDIPDTHIRINKKLFSEDWLSRLEEMRLKFYRLTQWDFLNRFSGARGILLWRGISSDEEEGYLGLRSGDIVEIQDRYFSHLPHYAISFASENSPIVVAYIPFSSLRMTSWLRHFEDTYEPEILVSGQGEFRDLIHLDSPDLERLDKLQKECEKALRKINNLDERDLKALDTKAIVELSSIQDEYLVKKSPLKDKPKDKVVRPPKEGFIPKIGDRVRLDIFGNGTIKKIDYEEDSIEIIFDETPGRVHKFIYSAVITHLKNINLSINEPTAGSPLKSQPASLALNERERVKGAALNEVKEYGGIDIDLSQIDLTLKDEKYVSSLNPADQQILLAAKYFKDGWQSLTLLYIHQIMLFFKDNLIKDIQQRDLLFHILKQLQTQDSLDPQALQFLNFLHSQRPLSEMRVALYR